MVVCARESCIQNYTPVLMFRNWLVDPVIDWVHGLWIRDLGLPLSEKFDLIVDQLREIDN
jgi:hypothetical protein